jgi:hypothetical protein
VRTSRDEDADAAAAVAGAMLTKPTRTKMKTTTMIGSGEIVSNQVGINFDDYNIHSLPKKIS